MSVTVGKYKCMQCEDIFEATSGKYTKCKCGKSEIDPHSFGYSYKQENKVEVIEQHSYYLESEFVKLPEDINKTYEEIKAIIEANGYKYFHHEYHKKGKNGEKYLSNFNITYSECVRSYSSERNEISLYVNLEKDRYEGDDTVRLRLNKFLDLMKKIESGDIKISKRSEMIKMADDEDIDYREEPTGDTNYTFYF